MDKNLIIKVLGILLIIFGCNWYVANQKLNDARDQIRAEQTVAHKATNKMEDVAAINSDLEDQNKSLKYSESHIQDGQQVKNDRFTLDYEDDGGGDYTVTIYPNKKNERMIAQQGDGAKGLEIVNVPKTDKRTTTAN